MLINKHRGNIYFYLRQITTATNYSQQNEFAAFCQNSHTASIPVEVLEAYPKI